MAADRGCEAFEENEIFVTKPKKKSFLGNQTEFKVVQVVRKVPNRISVT